MCIDFDKWYSEYVAERTEYYRGLLGFAPGETTTHNNRSDAFKHVFTSATLVLLTTWIGSLLLTNKHEWKNLDSGSPVDESIMDFHNNKLGRQIGLKALGWLVTFRYSERKLAEEIAKNVINSVTINGLDDHRIQLFKEDPAPLFDRDCDCERFKKYLRK